MEPNAQKGQEFMKAVVKASLYALFSIGVRSQVNIDKFITAFTENLDKSFKDLGMIKEVPMVGSSSGQEAVPPSEPLTDEQAPLISTIIENTMILKALKKEGITKVSDLILEMSKRDLTEIKGIGKKSMDIIRKEISEWKG